MTSRRLAALGLGSVGVILLGMVLAALPYQGVSGEAYSPLNHFISELGQTSVSRFSWAFNLGLVVGGAGLGLFLLLLANRLAGPYRAALLIVGVVSGISGTLVGVFPMDEHAPHRLVSRIFFLTGWLLAAIVSAWILAGRRPALPRWLLVPGGVVVAVSMAFIAVYSTYNPTDPDGPLTNRPDGTWAVATLEWASLLALLAWFICVSIALLRDRPE
ncbi:MAG TPA: DUF998 domain-containing protein [Candidatus Limnocylindrales bacterium]